MLAYLISALITEEMLQVEVTDKLWKISVKLLLQPWTKLVEIKVENPVNSRNDSIFKIPNSPPYPPISMLNLAEFCCQKPKNLPTTLIWGRGVFSLKNRFSILSQQFCPRL